MQTMLLNLHGCKPFFIAGIITRCLNTLPAVFFCFFFFFCFDYFILHIVIFFSSPYIITMSNRFIPLHPFYYTPKLLEVYE